MAKSWVLCVVVLLAGCAHVGKPPEQAGPLDGASEGGPLEVRDLGAPETGLTRWRLTAYGNVTGNVSASTLDSGSPCSVAAVLETWPEPRLTGFIGVDRDHAILSIRVGDVQTDASPLVPPRFNGSAEGTVGGPFSLAPGKTLDVMLAGGGGGVLQWRGNATLERETRPMACGAGPQRDGASAMVAGSEASLASSVLFSAERATTALVWHVGNSTHQDVTLVLPNDAMQVEAGDQRFAVAPAGDSRLDFGAYIGDRRAVGWFFVDDAWECGDSCQMLVG